MKVIVKKRFEEGDLTVMLLAINLLLVEFNAKSQEFYGAILEQLKRVTFKEYMVMKTQMKEGHNSRRALMKILKEHKLMSEEELMNFNNLYPELTKVPDPWGTDCKFTFTVLRDLRVKLSEFLSCRVFIPACSYHVLNDNILAEAEVDDVERNEEFTLD